MESANMVTCYFCSKEGTKVVIVNQAFVQRKHQQFKLIHLAAMERKFSRSRKFILSKQRKWVQVTHNIISRVLSPVPRHFAFYLYHVSQVGQKPWSNLHSYAYSMPGLARRQSNMCTRRRIGRDLLFRSRSADGQSVIEKEEEQHRSSSQIVSIHSFEKGGE